MKTPEPPDAVNAVVTSPPAQQAGISPKGRHTAFFRTRGLTGGVILAPVIALVVLSKPPVSHDSVADHALEIAGWSFFLLYLVFRIWPTMYVGGRKDQELQMRGPYSICRNPLYLGSLCSALALVLFLHSLTLFLAVAVLAACYAHLVIPSEEAVLRNRFGDAFDQYAARTPRLWPAPARYTAGESVTVNVSAMRRELKRLAAVSLAIFAAFVSCHWRTQSWWPQLLTLP